MGAPQGPPSRLDVIVGEGDVRVVPVHPHTQALELLGHQRDVVEGPLLALLDEFFNSHPLLDFLFGFDAKLLLNFDFDWQPVAVPSWLTEHVEAAHTHVAQDGVLDYLVPGGPQMNGPARVGWAVEEVPRLGSRAELLHLFIDIVCLPPRLNLRLGFARIVRLYSRLNHFETLNLVWV